jgi:O-antigen/teichoic acid export membrane protein
MWLLNRLGLEEVGAYAVLIPIIAVLTTINMSAGYIMTRSGAFGLSAWASIAASVIGNFSKLALGLTWPSTLSLIAGNAIGYLLGPLMAFRLSRRMATGLSSYSSERLWEIARNHWDFAFLRAPQNFLAAISQSLPILALTASFGPKSAGFYAVAIALAGAPISLIGNAVQTVLYPRLTEVSRAGRETTGLLLHSTLWLAVIGTPIFALIVAFGPWLFATLLGPEWREAGVYSALLVPWLWLGLANRPAISLIPIIGLQSGLLLYEIIGTVAKLAALMVGQQVFVSARWTVGLFSGVGALAYSLLIAWVVWSSHKGVRKCADEKTS